ncbi:MAG: hypothetical protein ABIQ11_03430, partial [Saprospiraceae bacterium]
MKTHRFTSFIIYSGISLSTINAHRGIWRHKLFCSLAFILFASSLIHAQQCPVTTCQPIHITSINLATVPECGVGTTSVVGDIQGSQPDCENGPNNCHEFIMFRPAGSVTQQFTLEVGQGSGCNGELDATFSYINGVCDTLSNGGSNTTVIFTFPTNVDTIILFLCLNSAAFVKICDLCAAPPPCDMLPICNLNPIDIMGCAASVPAPFTNPADVFTNIPTCAGTTLILTSQDQGDVLFCTAPAGVNFIRTYTLSFIDAVGDTVLFRTCPQSIKVTPQLPVAFCQNATVQLNSMGMVTINASQVNNNSTLGCGGVLSVNPSSFTCANLGPNTVTLTVTDVCGNTSTCTATVTVQTTTPTADAGPP